MSLIHPDLASVLRCPVDKGSLNEEEESSRLICTECGRRYPVRDGIPIMLVDEAEGAGDD